jgi:hypothetical protein
MAKGPFGNPLSTGIALSGVIDMVTPVRQAQERKRKRQAEEKAAQDKRAKELGSIMGKIAIDEDKIWWRYHDDARSQYANTIDKVQQMYSAGDYAGMYKTINDFDSRMANYTQATIQKNEWKKSVEKGDKYYDQSYLNALENRDVDMADLVGLADQSGFGMHDENTNILGFINPVDRVDLRASMKKAVEGQKFEYDKVGKKLDVVGYGANGEPVYRMSLQDKDNTINAVKNSISPQAVPYMLMELGYSKEDQTKMSPAELAQKLDQELDKVYGLYATQEQMGSKPTVDKGDFVWSSNSGRNKNWAWSLSKGGNVNVRDEDVNIEKRLNINRVSGGVAENEFTLGTDALIQDVATGGTQGVFVDANIPKNTVYKGTPTAVLEIKGNKFLEFSSAANLTDSEEDRILQLSRLQAAVGISPAEEQELQELQKLKVKATYLIPFSKSIESQLYNSLGIVGKQADQMKSYFDGGGASGSSTVKTRTKAQAQKLMSAGGFSTEAELIADLKKRGITLKITS